jgi:hypothetical protein
LQSLNNLKVLQISSLEKVYTMQTMIFFRLARLALLKESSVLCLPPKQRKVKKRKRLLKKSLLNLGVLKAAKQRKRKKRRQKNQIFLKYHL